MRPADLSPTELIDLLDDAYREDRGGPPSGLASAERAALADDLECHSEQKTDALYLWQERLAWQGGDTEDAEFWLDVELLGAVPKRGKWVQRRSHDEPWPTCARLWRVHTLAWLPLVGALTLSACGTTEPPPTPYDASGAWTAEFTSASGKTVVLGASITMANKPRAGDFTMFLGGDVALFMYGNTVMGELHYYYEPRNIYRGTFENDRYVGTLKDDAGNLVYTLRLTRPE